MSVSQHGEELGHIEDVLNRWDPLGVVEEMTEAGATPAEYSDYAPHVLRLLAYGCSIDDLCRYFQTVQRTKMGVTPNSNNDWKIAKELVLWWEEKRAA